MMTTPYKDGYTELHFQARYGSPLQVLDLLRQGATMACKNNYGALPLGDIHPKILETHLDECIVPEFIYDPYEEKPSDEVIKETIDAKINYHSLLPRKSKINLECTTPILDDIDDPDVDQEQVKPNLMSNKGKRSLMSKIWKTNKKPLKVKEMEVVQYISESEDLQYLLKHPTIESFVDIRWLQFRWLLYINVFHSAMMCVFLILYEQLNLVGNYFLYVFLVADILIEVVDLLLSPREYVRTLKNYVDLFLIAAIIYIVFGSDLSEERVQLITATAILLSALESLLFLGLFQQFSKYVLMLQRVAIRFVKFFCYYLMFVVAFAFCFYSLFKRKTNGDVTTGTNGNGTKSNGDDATNGFGTVGLAIFKTLVMITGEYNSGDMIYEPYPVASRLILVVYIFTISIILMNLLNGLAVSDIQKIETEAEILSITAKVHYMVHINNYYSVQNLFSSFIVFMNRFLPRAFLGSSKLYKNTTYSIKLRFNYNNRMRVRIISINDELLKSGGAYLTSGNTISNLQDMIKKKRFAKFVGKDFLTNPYWANCGFALEHEGRLSMLVK